MAPIKFEENIKDRLEKRTIKPSSKAWGSLSEQLGQAEVKKSNNRYWWIGVAASVVGVLLMINVFFENKTPEILVDSDEINKTIEVVKSPEKEELLQKETIVENTINVIVEAENSEVENAVAVNKEENKKDKQSSIKKRMNATKKSVEQSSTKTEAVAFLNESRETNKQEELVAEVVKSRENKTTVSDLEIELLLNKANEDIAMQSPKAGQSVPIDPNGLLQDVEDDLEESFRDKMLKKVKSGYNTVRTAVVERND